MKSIRNIAFAAIMTIGAFSAVTYTSCNKDECKGVECANGGTCINGTCSCPTGYEGALCDVLSRDKFIGTYTGSETCDAGTDNYTITISANSDKIKLTLTNLYNDNYTATCTMTGTNSFSFSGTQSGVTFTGTGSLATTQLTVNYSLSDGVLTNACTFIGSK